MYTNNPHIKTEIVNGQAVYIPDIEGWKMLQVDSELDGVSALSADLVEWVNYILKFIQRNPGFSLALYKPSSFKLFWLICVLLKTSTGWQRVHLETLKCESCSWEGITANPLLSDLYIGVPDKQAALHATYSYPALPCPKCGSKLPRYPIWVEPLEDSDSHTRLQIEERQ